MVGCDVKTLKQKDKIIGDPALLCYRGSKSQGLYEGELDDTDLLSVYIAPYSHYMGFPKNKHNKGRDRWHEDYDIVNYELRKFTTLCKGINPNVLSGLWCKDDHVIESTHIGKTLRNNRALFYDTKGVYDSFGGYARGQYNRMKKDRNNLEEIKRLKRLHYRRKNIDLEHELEKEYQRLSEKYYSGWMGRKRKEMVLEYGYDPKHLAHTLRLLRMGREFLETRRLQIDRTNIDKEEIMEMKNGSLEFGDACDKIENEFDLFEDQYESIEKFVEVDEGAIESLLMSLLNSYFTQAQ